MTRSVSYFGLGLVAIVYGWFKAAASVALLWFVLAYIWGVDPFSLLNLWNQVALNKIETTEVVLILAILISLIIGWWCYRKCLAPISAEKSIYFLHIFAFVIGMSGFLICVTMLLFRYIIGTTSSSTFLLALSGSFVATLAAKPILLAHWYPPADVILARDKRPHILYLRSFKTETAFGYVRRVCSFIRTESFLMFGLTIKMLRAASRGDDDALENLGSDTERRMAALLTRAIVPFTPANGIVSKIKATIAGRSAGDEQIVLADYLLTLGPYIAFKKLKHNEGWSEVGASRLGVASVDWQSRATTLIKSAAAVVIDIGTTPSLAWEIEQVIKLVDPHKVLIITSLLDKDYFAFLDALGHLFPVPLPREKRNFRFVTFDEGWKPMPIRVNIAGDKIDLHSLPDIETVLAPFVFNAGLERVLSRVHAADGFIRSVLTAITGDLNSFHGRFIEGSFDEKKVDFDEVLTFCFEAGVKTVINSIAEIGCPTQNEYYVEFDQNADDVIYRPCNSDSTTKPALPQDLLRLAFQNCFWALRASEDDFSVTLKFNDGYDRIIVPIKAVVSFGDETAGRYFHRPNSSPPSCDADG
jgi:hypothetical protein